jgi:hypothetical protein
MGDYRLYFHDFEGHIIRSIEMVCADDAEAIAWAQRIANGNPVELWELARMVFDNRETGGDA